MNQIVVNQRVIELCVLIIRLWVQYFLVTFYSETQGHQLSVPHSLFSLVAHPSPGWSLRHTDEYTRDQSFREEDIVPVEHQILQ